MCYTEERLAKIGRHSGSREEERSYRVSGGTWVFLKTLQQWEGWRGLGRRVWDNWVSSNSMFLCLSLCASFIRGGQWGILKPSQQEMYDCVCCWVLTICIFTDVCANSNEHLSKWAHMCLYIDMHSSGNLCAYVCACVMEEQPAIAHLTLCGGKAELELLEGGETGSSSLHTSLFKGAIKVWQKCQCCRQGTGLWMSVLLRSTLRFSQHRPKGEAGGGGADEDKKRKHGNSD